MKFNINIIPINQEEETIFSIHQMTPRITEIIDMLSDNNKSFILNKSKIPSHILGKIEETFYKVNLEDIFYVESVDRKVYLYTKNKNYEMNEKLYVLEEMLTEVGFVRISKSMLLNMDKIYSFSPTFSGNLEALLLNKEKVVISRRYVANLKKQLGMGEV